MLVFLASQPWARKVARQFFGTTIMQKEFLTRANLEHLGATMVFSLHWHWMVPKDITDNFHCINFHSSDLPKFRGGSPIQNQLKRGITKTKLTAHRMTENLDDGDIYLQEDLSLEGDMEMIIHRIEYLAPRMIRRILRGDYVPREQVGEPSFYTRKDAE